MTNRIDPFGKVIIQGMAINLEILEARNVIAKPAGDRDSLFVRYYLSSGNGKGNNIIAVNTRDVMATPNPQWKQTFCLECGGNIDDVNIISALQKQLLVRFEVRKKSSRMRVLGSMFRASELMGWVEIAWKDLLASPTLSINDWFPLISDTRGGSELPPSLHLAISIDQPPQERGTEMEMYDSAEVIMSCRNEVRRNYLNVNRRITRLERDGCRCGGTVCCQHLHDEGIFAVVM
eukprot:PITA_02284